MIAVALNTAYCWKCPHSSCRQANFLRPEMFDAALADDGELAQVRDMLGLESWQDVPAGVIEVAPAEVRCSRCGRTYPVTEVQTQ